MTEAAEIITTEDALGVLAIENVDVTPFLVDTDKRRAFMDRVREVGLTAGSDVSTAKSRDKIISMAAKVTRCKTAIDKAGLEMTEDWRQKTAEVNAARKEVKDDFTQLAADIRRPVTEWEQAEEDRKLRAAEILRVLREIVHQPVPSGGPTAQGFESLLERTKELELAEDVLGDDLDFAQRLKTDAVRAVEKALADFQQAEADREELEALRREKAERDAREAEEQRKREEEAAEKERAKREAAEAKAREEEQRRAAEEAEQLAQQRAAEAAERARQEERERIEAEQRKQREAEEKERAAAERKAQNAKHRARILTEIAEALEAQFGLDGGQSLLIADAIAGGHVPHTSIQF